MQISFMLINRKNVPILLNIIILIISHLQESLINRRVHQISRTNTNNTRNKEDSHI